MGSDFRDESLKSKLILTLVVHNLIIGCCTYPIKTSEQKKKQQQQQQNNKNSLWVCADLALNNWASFCQLQ